MSPALQDVSWLDALSVLLIVSLGVFGAIKGAIRLLIGLAALVAGTILAGRYADRLGASGWPVVADLEDPQRVGVLIGGAVILIGCLLAGAVLARLLRRAAEETALGGVDRLLGLVFGVLRGVLCAALVTFGVMALTGAVTLPAVRQDASASYSLRGTRGLLEACRPWLPEDTAQTLATILEPGDG